jgi:hypothetical protein
LVSKVVVYLLVPVLFLKTVRPHTGCEGYWRPIFNIVSCISHYSDHDKIFTVYSPLHLLLSTYCPFAGKIKGPSGGESESSHCQNNLRWKKETEKKKIKQQGI